jgi:hypothetical protein
VRLAPWLGLVPAQARARGCILDSLIAFRASARAAPATLRLARNLSRSGTNPAFPSPSMTNETCNAAADITTETSRPLRDECRARSTTTNRNSLILRAPCLEEELANDCALPEEYS